MTEIVCVRPHSRRSGPHTRGPPENESILFLREANGTGHAIVANADGSRLHVVYRGAFDSALWSPDSQSIAFGAGPIVNATTGAVKRRLDFRAHAVTCVTVVASCTSRSISAAATIASPRSRFLEPAV